MVFNVVVMKPICLIVYMMKLERTPVILTEILELAVVISLFIQLYHLYFHVRCDNVFLLAPPCIEGEVQLLSDKVQICHHEVWGYVCSTYDYWFSYDWTDDDARVVCRELGFFYQGVTKMYSFLHPLYLFYI